MTCVLTQQTLQVGARCGTDPRQGGNPIDVRSCWDLLSPAWRMGRQLQPDRDLGVSDERRQELGTMMQPLQFLDQDPAPLVGVFGREVRK